MHTRFLVPVVACLTFPLLAMAQDGRLRLPDLGHLQAHATQSVNVTLGPFALQFASWFMDDADPEVARVKKTFSELKSVTVRSFKLDTDLAAHDPGIEDLRRQLSMAGWLPLVQVHDRDRNEDVGVYVAHDERIIHGLAVLAVKPREVTLVHLSGSIEMERLAELRQALGSPDTAVAKGQP
jgi:hypothetical protein